MDFTELDAAKKLLLLSHKIYMDSNGTKGTRLSFAGEDLSGVDFNGAYIDAPMKDMLIQTALRRASSKAMKNTFGEKLPDYSGPVDKGNSR